MDTLRPTAFRSDELLLDERFWGQLYWSYMESLVGDPFEDGLDYFLSIGSQEANDWIEELESLRADEGHYPEVSVTVPLRNRWRAGVILSCYPEDFEIQEILVPPRGDHTVISVSGGNTWLPGLRWEELLAIANAVLPVASASKERAILLLYPSVGLTQRVFAKEARAILRKCWQESGLTIQHVDELLDRLAQHHVRNRWRWNAEHGWTNDGEGSLRNPRSQRARPVLQVVKRFFASLAE
jgi:hypothetical protein